MIKLYGIPNCNKIRNTQKLLEANKINFEFINVRKTPISADKLNMMIDELGMENMYNRKGATYRRLNLDYEKMSDKERFVNILQEQSMIKRPLIEKNDHYHIGFDETAILDFIAG
jgi:Spx/MgsR family transcriptional regulator